MFLAKYNINILQKNKLKNLKNENKKTPYYEGVIFFIKM